MANTTFNGPVRSENGFENITIDSNTGAVTTGPTFGISGVVAAPVVLTDANTTLTAAANAGRVNFTPVNYRLTYPVQLPLMFWQKTALTGISGVLLQEQLPLHSLTSNNL
jgi:hypothetical protein